MNSPWFSQTRAKKVIKFKCQRILTHWPFAARNSLPNWCALCHSGADNPLCALVSGCAVIYRQRIKMFIGFCFYEWFGTFGATNFSVRSKFSACGAAKPHRHNSIFSNLFRLILSRRFSASGKEMRKSRILFIDRRRRQTRIFRLGHLLKQMTSYWISWILSAACDSNRHYVASLFLDEKRHTSRQQEADRSHSALNFGINQFA